jgi:polyribonucleotide nucleotidyltransferase
VTKITSATWTSRSPARKNGITSLQMDIKITGITEGDHGDRPRSGQGRPHAHPRRDGQGIGRSPRVELGEHAPRIEQLMTIPTDKIREVIGSGGKVIREIVEKTGAKINIDDDGT